MDAVPEVLVELLMDMGFPRDAAVRGLRQTGGGSVEAAMNCILENPDGAGADASRGSHDADTGPMKMVLVVRKDLAMGTGKIAAQCSHGSLGAYLDSAQKRPHLVDAWMVQGQAKIVLQVESGQALLRIAADAITRGLVAHVVTDAGKTQVSPGSETVVAIGPAPAAEIDVVTGGLRLL